MANHCWFRVPLTEYEPSHEIMVLSVLHKLILQMRMRSHPVGATCLILVGPFVYFHTSCVRTTKVLARLCGSAGSPEPSLVAYVISTIISCESAWTPLEINLRVFMGYPWVINHHFVIRSYFILAFILTISEFV